MIRLALMLLFLYAVLAVLLDSSAIAAAVVLPLSALTVWGLLTGRLRTRCPYCGKAVKIGYATCHHCGRQVVNS